MAAPRFGLLSLQITMNRTQNCNSFDQQINRQDAIEIYATPFLFPCFQPDGYRSGCYNLRCPGFVQISGKVSLGAAIAPVSTYSGPQYDIAFAIWKGRSSGNWWLRVGTEVVGYWPASLFTDLRNHAKTVEYGGEVMYENSSGHTSTQMGSGHFEGGPGKTAYTRNLKVVDSNNIMKDVSNLHILAEKPNCYSIQKGYNDVYRNKLAILSNTWTICAIDF
ncbi:protein neprosin-like [Bidens hawaiensis]|uniref:protein neprosin-like n=1 Tax=Bidens hawaiensis TaxID=980011 RepID=UPI004049B1EE